MTPEQTKEVLYGKKKTLTLPSGFSVTIREQNGNDDDILSNADTAKDLTNIHIFLSSLILETDLPYAKNGKLSANDIKKMLLRDKYFIMFASRIHSMGPEVRFKFNWGKDNGGEIEYTDNLENFVWDYTKELPEEGTEDYYEHRIMPYPEDAHDKIELTLGSGKEIRFQFLNGFGEQLMMKTLTPTKNTKLKARMLEQKIEGEWQKVENFMYFSKRDMIELNKIITEIDAEFTGITEIVHPQDSTNIINYPIMQAHSFFYPEEI